MVKVLIWGSIGTISSPWTSSFIDRVLRDNDEFDIYILDTQISDYYIDKYTELGVHFIHTSKEVREWYLNNKRGGIIKSLWIHCVRLFMLIKSKDFDIINFHFVDSINLMALTILKRIFGAKLILSYWGSDLFRVSDFKLKVLSVFVRKADYVTFDNEDLRTKNEKIYKGAKVERDTIMFGLSVLEVIKNKFTCCSREAIRQSRNIDTKKNVIAIGYNGIEEQQHLAVLEQIAKLEPDIKDSIVLLIQMTYGGTPEYHSTVRNTARNTGCECVFLEDYLRIEEIADYRISTDIFINAQKTDAFSGSVCECLFAGAVVINARWLRYKEFEKYGIEYVEFEDFNAIPDAIRECLQMQHDCERNRETIWQLRSWESCAPKWKDMYNHVISMR